MSGLYEMTILRIFPLLLWLQIVMGDIKIVYRNGNPVSPTCILDDGRSGICTSFSKCSEKKGKWIHSCVKKIGFGICCQMNNESHSSLTTTISPETDDYDLVINNIHEDREINPDKKHINEPLELSDADYVQGIKTDLPPLVSEFHTEKHSGFYHKTLSWADPQQGLIFEHHTYGNPPMIFPETETYGYKRPWYPGKPMANVKLKHKKIKLESICGKTTVRRPNIYNGEEALPGEFPWQVSLRAIEGFSTVPKCGATLIHPRWIITAAHCAREIPIENMVVRAGSNIVEKVSGLSQPSTYLDATVRQEYIHPDFIYDLVKVDIALLKLNTAFPVTDYLRPICLPPEGDFIGQLATLTGWGRNATDGPLQKTLQKVELPIITNKECDNWVKHNRPSTGVEDTLMCTGRKEGGKDACVGDSGGPVQKKVDQHWVLLGIISWGTNDCGAPYSPSANTKVSKFTDWIRNVTRNEVCVPSFFQSYSYTTTSYVTASTTIIEIPEAIPNTIGKVEATTHGEITKINTVDTPSEVEATKSSIIDTSEVEATKSNIIDTSEAEATKNNIIDISEVEATKGSTIVTSAEVEATRGNIAADSPSEVEATTLRNLAYRHNTRNKPHRSFRKIAMTF